MTKVVTKRFGNSAKQKRNIFEKKQVVLDQLRREQIEALSTGTSGSNANGNFVQFADGTQICYHTVPTVFVDANNILDVWTFPSEFTLAPNVRITPSGATISDAKLGGSMAVALSTTTTSTTPTLKSNGLYTSGDAQDLYCVATGKWK